MSAGPDDVPRAGFAALIGWTNVGKSTLLNRLIGTKLAAVSGAAQTTRRRLIGARTVPGRGQVLFVDTPGLHEPHHRLNRGMIDATRRASREVDLGLLVLDAARGIGPGDRAAADLVRAAAPAALAVLNKIDLLRDKSRLLPLIATLAESWGFSTVVPVSARTGEGCEALLDAVLRALPPGPPLHPEEFLTDQPERVLAAEWIREKLLAELRDELPHATAVTVERWSDTASGVTVIEAAVLVERESQKPIVVGRGGERLRRAGTTARQELEALLGRRVLLRLWVRVRESWRDDARALRELGLDGAE